MLGRDLPTTALIYIHPLRFSPWAWRVKRKITFFFRYALHYYAKVGCPQISSENRKSLHAVQCVHIVYYKGADVHVQCRTYIIIAKRRLQPGRINGERLHRLPRQQGNNNWATGLVSFLAFLTRNFNPGGISSRMMILRSIL